MARLFWAYDGASGLGTPPRLYNQIVRQVAAAQGNDAAKNARLFALVNAAMADAGVLACGSRSTSTTCGGRCWAFGSTTRRWGPPAPPATGCPTSVTPNWLPLGAPNTNRTGKNSTPPFPAYPSGRATFGAAALHMTRLFYNVTKPGPDALLNGLSFVSEELNGVNRDNRGTVRPRHVRKFKDGLWGMIQENSISRVFLGVHWIFDGYVPASNGAIDTSRNIGGVPLGLRIAEDIFNGGRAKGLHRSVV
ncbi:MAG: vanadium-dependent haloperoxidase [Actinomycetota bacterium]|nr:vanadium-dependent haloperoxidase [Actinomycetota bacterium]